MESHRQRMTDLAIRSLKPKQTVMKSPIPVHAAFILWCIRPAEKVLPSVIASTVRIGN
jgi:hypothetical protein